MTAITILNGDFEILFEDETVGGNAVAGMKMIRRTSGAAATNYTTNALYSAVADAADDFQAMGFENPMLPVTLNAYTMENDYFIPRSSTEWLQEGAIEADWDLNIVSIAYVATIADFDTGDIGRQVVGGTTGDTGTLLDFEILPDGTLLAWIRPDDPTPVTGDLFDDPSETLTCTGDTGTGNTTSTAASTTGTSLYSSIQAIGAVPTATEVYLIQEREKMTDSTTGLFQWWDTDPNVSLGIIDILIRVKRDSVEIADGDVEIFARRYTSLYDQFRLNVAAGGRSALPLASAPDINNTTGYRVMTATGVTGTFDVGNIVMDTVTIATATKKGVITAVDATVPATPIIEYYLVGDLTDFAGGETLQEYDVTTLANGDAVSTGNGAPAANLLGPTDATAGEGGTVTIVLGTTTFDHDGVGGPEPYSITIDAQDDVPAAKVYERIKYVTRRGADELDLFGAGINIPGETYRGLELQAQYVSPVGTFGEGEDVTSTSVPGYSSRAISVNTTDTYIMLTDQQTSLKSITDTDLIEDEGGDSVTVSGTPVSIVSPKSSPFGTFTGTVIFGARGVLYINPHTSDTQNYILTDDNGTQRTPPNTVAFTVNNTIALDRILVGRDTGTAGVIDKDQFGGLGGADAVGSLTVTVAGSIDTEVAKAGFIRIVHTTLQEEHHYEYDSYVSGAAGTFALRDVNEGTGITTLSTPTDGIATLTDTSATFQTAPVVEVGMLVRNTTATKLHHVWEVVSVDSTTELTVRQLYGPLDATQDWDASDTYTINTLIGDHAAAPVLYGVGDDVFDLLIDEEATTTSVSNTFVKILTSPFNVVVNVRQGKIILPFTQNPTVGDSGGSVTVVRAQDTIAT